MFDKWLKKHPKDLPPGSGSSSSSGKGGSSSGSKGGRKVVCRRDDTGVQAQVCEVSDSGDQNNATNWGTSKDTGNGTYYLPDEDPKLWNSTLQSAATGSGGVTQPTGTATADAGSQKRSEIGKRALTTDQLIEIVTNGQSNVRWNGIKVRKWRSSDTSGSIGTGELCGCTTVVIWSNKATLVAHLPETRADIEENQRWWPAPDMPPLLQQAVIQDQANADDDFAENAYQRIREVYNENDFPRGETQAVIVAPYNNGQYWRLNTLGVPRGLYYPNQYQLLQQMLRTDFIRSNFNNPSGYSNVVSVPYYATDMNSPSYQQAQINAQDIVAVNLEIINGRRTLVLYANGVPTGATYRMNP